jgi:hypothetical protein
MKLRFSEHENRIYMREMCELTGRDRDTFYNWEKVWPIQLMPQRGYQNKRYWTREQLEWILEWRDMMDSRNLLFQDNSTAEARKRKAAVNYHKPRKFKFKHIVRVRRAISVGCSRQEIAEDLFTEVTYRTFDAFDKALVWLCRYHGWPVPPRYLNRYDLQGARTMAKRGVKLEPIINHLFRRTAYTDHVELEGDLVRAFYLRDWPIPTSDPSIAWADKLTPRMKAEIHRFERQLEAIESLLDK